MEATPATGTNLVRVIRVTVLHGDKQIDVSAQGDPTPGTVVEFTRAVLTQAGEESPEGLLLGLRRLGLDVLSVSVRENPVVLRSVWLE